MLPKEFEENNGANNGANISTERSSTFQSTSSYGSVLSDVNPVHVPSSCVPFVTKATLVQICLFLAWCIHTSRVHMFDFGVVLIVFKLYPESLVPAALYASVFLLVTVLFAPTLGRLLDVIPRRVAVVFVLSVEIVGIILTAGCLYLLLWWEDDHDGGPFSSWQAGITFSGLLGCTVPVALGTTGFNIIIERDWVPAIFSETFLPTMNARMGRLALLAQAVGPIVAGALLQYVGLYGLLAITCWALLSSLGEAMFLYVVFIQCPQLSQRREKRVIDHYGESGSESQAYYITPSVTPHSTVTSKEIHSHNAHQKSKSSYCLSFLYEIAFWFPALNFFRAFAVFLKQRAVLIPILGYSALWFTVLSPQSVLLFAYLHSQGWDDLLLSALRGTGALFAVVTTLVWPLLVRKIGLIWSSRVYLLCFVPVIMASAVFYHFGYGGAGYVWANWLFVSLVAFGAVFSTGYRFGQVQILQMGTEEEHRGVVNSFEAGTTAVFALAPLIIGAAVHHPSEFKYLVWLSVAFAFMGCCLFILWSCHRPSVQYIMLRSQALQWAADTPNLERYHGSSEGTVHHQRGSLRSDRSVGRRVEGAFFAPTMEHGVDGHSSSSHATIPPLVVASAPTRPTPRIQRFPYTSENTSSGDTLASLTLSGLTSSLSMTNEFRSNGESVFE